MSLYQMTTDFRRLLEAIESGEIPEEAVSDTLEAVSGAWEERMEAVLAAIKNLKAEQKNISEEEKALAERRKKKAKAVERLSDYVASSIRAVGKDRYESARHVVSFRRSSAIRITDIDAFISYAMMEHPEAVRIKETLEPDKEAIKELIKTVDLPYISIDVNDNIQIK